MARVDESRAASQFHAVENPKPGGSSNLAERRAQVEESAARRRAQAGSSEGAPNERGVDDNLRQAREAAAEARRRRDLERTRDLSRVRGMDRSR
jgi:hypothetical protein